MTKITSRTSSRKVQPLFTSKIITKRGQWHLKQETVPKDSCQLIENNAFQPQSHSSNKDGFLSYVFFLQTYSDSFTINISLKVIYPVGPKRRALYTEVRLSPISLLKGPENIALPVGLRTLGWYRTHRVLLQGRWEVDVQWILYLRFYFYEPSIVTMNESDGLANFLNK